MEVIDLDKSYKAYEMAAVAVANGTANSEQIYLCEQMAKVAGPIGQKCRDALKKAGRA